MLTRIWRETRWKTADRAFSMSKSQVLSLFRTMPAVRIDEPDGTLQGHCSAAGRAQKNDAFQKGQNKLNVQLRRM